MVFKLYVSFDKRLSIVLLNPAKYTRISIVPFERTNMDSLLQDKTPRDFSNLQVSYFFQAIPVAL